jgi:hypothetical protein
MTPCIHSTWHRGGSADAEAQSRAWRGFSRQPSYHVTAGINAFDGVASGPDVHDEVADALDISTVTVERADLES